VTTIQSEVFEAFRDVGVPEDKAMKAASALSPRDEDVVSLSRDMTLLKWMMGFVLAFQVAIFVKQFIH
jgi:hypothetical protein